MSRAISATLGQRTERLRVLRLVHSAAISGVTVMTSGLQAAGAVPLLPATASGAGVLNGVRTGRLLIGRLLLASFGLISAPAPQLLSGPGIFRLSASRGLVDNLTVQREPLAVQSQPDLADLRRPEPLVGQLGRGTAGELPHGRDARGLEALPHCRGRAGHGNRPQRVDGCGHRIRRAFLRASRDQLANLALPVAAMAA